LAFGATEVDQTMSFGWDLRGDWWHRLKDKWGVALVTNRLSRRHRRYLAQGGPGFVLVAHERRLTLMDES
jgi:high affinity Mn2+ porin